MHDNRYSAAVMMWLTDCLFYLVLHLLFAPSERLGILIYTSFGLIHEKKIGCNANLVSD